ncbi:MAG: hypothetical protein HKO58_05525 [Gammaproteobacteria bacterium]|nr:hypothetical protein [Gammaproteobacteria bacterium]
MITSIPVLQDMNGYYVISIYETTTDGHFRRTAKRPFKSLAGVIAGVSAPVGTIEAKPRTRNTLNWRSPTVISYEEHHPSSAYKFFRRHIKQHEYYIATADNNSDRIRKLNLHHIHFRSGVSPSIKELFITKFIKSMRLWGFSKLRSKY